MRALTPAGDPAILGSGICTRTRDASSLRQPAYRPVRVGEPASAHHKPST